MRSAAMVSLVLEANALQSMLRRRIAFFLGVLVEQVCAEETLCCLVGWTFSCGVVVSLRLCDHWKAEGRHSVSWSTSPSILYESWPAC
jgi:hypothetical protein